MKDDFVIRGYRQGDEYAILEMFNEVFNQSRDISHWHWKYRNHPWGGHYISLALTSEGLPVAHYGGYPVRMTIHSPEKDVKEFLTFQLGDKMTRAGFRNVGIRTRGLLARSFFHFRDLYGQYAPFGFGFGTHHSLRMGILLFKYMKVEKIPFRKLDLSGYKNPHWRKIMPAVHRIHVEEIPDTGRDWTEFFHRVAPHYSCLTTRNEEYVRWRYISRPDKKYFILALKQKSKLLGWSVFSRDQEKLQWVDGLFDPAYVRYSRLILDHLRTSPFSRDAGIMHGWFPRRPGWWSRILDELGFVSEQEPDDLHLTGPVFNMADAEIFLRNNLYYTMGDSDLC